LERRLIAGLGLTGALTISVIAFGTAFMSTRRPMLGLPQAESWSDVAGAFTGAAAVFSAMAVIGILLTLHMQARDSAAQAENFKTSLAAQSNAIKQLEVAAKALSQQVADVSKTAEAASKQCNLAEQRLNLDLANRRLDRVNRLMDRLAATHQPSSDYTSGLTSLESPHSQTVWRARLGEDWRTSLRLVLEAALSLRDDADKRAESAVDVDDILDELRARITKEQKNALALAELTPAHLVRDDYRPSRLAVALKRARIFPFVPFESDLYLAWSRA